MIKSEFQPLFGPNLDLSQLHQAIQESSRHGSDLWYYYSLEEAFRQALEEQ